MTFIRKEVRRLGTPWNDTLLWYAKGVGELQSRPISEKTSWRYLAAMHGFHRTLWTHLGYLKAGDKLPPAAEQSRYWKQCQHQSWYFWPWHRAYLLSFERIVRAAVVALGGPHDWALPYWNYSDTSIPDTLHIPPAFVSKTLPDGSKNPLHVAARFGTSVFADDANLHGRLEDNDFVGISQGAGAGVGGPRTAFSHSGDQEGLVENKPHDFVHGDVGGSGGLMSDPRTAALDPIFWIHHANIDRLWEVWLQRNPKNHNPKDQAWLKGPSDKSFATFDANGADVPSKPQDVSHLSKLEYKYDDVSDPLGGATRFAIRATRLGIVPLDGELAAMAAPTSELLGSNDKALSLGKQSVSTEVKLAGDPVGRLTASFAHARSLAVAKGPEPNRVFLNLEHIKGNNGAAIFDVYVKAKSAVGASAEHHVGAISLFGLEQASDPSEPHGGRGLTKVLEITKAVDTMHIAQEDLNDALVVRIAPRSEIRNDDQVTVGQISLYRQGG